MLWVCWNSILFLSVPIHKLCGVLLLCCWYKARKSWKERVMETCRNHGLVLESLWTVILCFYMISLGQRLCCLIVRFLETNCSAWLMMRWYSKFHSVLLMFWTHLLLISLVPISARRKWSCVLELKARSDMIPSKCIKALKISDNLDIVQVSLSHDQNKLAILKSDFSVYEFRFCFQDAVCSYSFHSLCNCY